MSELFSRVKEISTVEVIQCFLPSLELKRGGSGRHIALCPFHAEDTPSFTVFERGWKCFGCGAAGSNIDLLLKANLASTPLEAAKMIADRFGITVERRRQTERKPLLLSQYVDYVKVPQEFLIKSFHLEETPTGLAIPYRDENGKESGFQLRHHLEKNEGRDTRFSWQKGSKPYLYGAWAIPRWNEKETKRVLLCEGASDIQVCWFNQIPALGVPGASAFKAEWVNLLLPIPEIVIVQEPGEAGNKFVKSICVALKKASYEGQVKAVSLSEKDPRDLWLKHKEAFKEKLERAISETLPLDLETLTDIEAAQVVAPQELQGRFIHPAIHIEKDFASVGVINREKGGFIFSIVTNKGGPYTAEHLGEGLFTVPALVHPQLADRWRRTEMGVTLSTSVALFIDKLRSLVWFEDERWYSVVSVWAAGTYLIQAFPAFPYLQLTGEKGSGKTKVQDALELVAFNAQKVVDPTPAVLFRIIHALRPTLLIDEAERLNSKECQELRTIINAGYKAGATTPRVEGEKKRTLTFFEVYSPMCFASIKSLGSVTEDRCITIVMSKPQSTDPRQNKAIDGEDLEWSVIRDGFYRLPLTIADRALALFRTGLDLPSWLRARDRELWSPLLAIASITDEESGLGLTDDLLGLAREAVNDKGLSFDSEAILGLLEKMLGESGAIKIHPVDLVEDLEAALNRKGRIGPEWIAGRLRSLGFKKANPSRDAKGVIYTITAEQIENFRQRYLPPGQPTNLHTQKPTHPQASEMTGEY